MLDGARPVYWGIWGRYASAPVIDALRLDGRAVIVTGASRGIGAAVAREAAALGAHVVAVARSGGELAALVAPLPGEGRTLVGGVADPATPEQALARAGALPRLRWPVHQ